MYSGHVAGAVYAGIELPNTVILVGPNHSGVGPAISVFPEGSWLIPGSEIPIERSIGRQIEARVSEAELDESAHLEEHCLEVQLPFLIAARPDLCIVPILVGTTDPGLCKKLGRCLAAIMTERGLEDGAQAAPLLVGTTDLTHYEADGVARQKDARAIEAICGMNPDKLRTVVLTHRITMCGLGPVIAVLEAAAMFDIHQAALVRYATSADAGGDVDRVVGYGGFIIRREGTGVESSVTN